MTYAVMGFVVGGIVVGQFIRRLLQRWLRLR